jgi:hypothetical protein
MFDVDASAGVESARGFSKERSRRGAGMRLPGRDDVVVTREKVRRYLLSSTHPVGRYKARWLSAFGFDVASWQTLVAALERHAAACDVAVVERTPFGARYVLEGPLMTPDGRNPLARSVWFIERGSKRPRFVTLYPLRRGEP